MAYLQNRFEQAGGVIQMQKLSRLDELATEGAAAVVNCTGLGARFLEDVRDENVYPTRGQLIIVRAPNVTDIWRYEGPDPQYPSYILPRGDGTAGLGGTMLANDLLSIVLSILADFLRFWFTLDDECNRRSNCSSTPHPCFFFLSSTQVNNDTAKDILARCAEMVPELQDASKTEILAHTVGLRPSRKGGVRLEVDPTKRIGSAVLVHCYGHGGFGKPFLLLGFVLSVHCC
jgi:D-amino-acid oxidase